jgi:hypothetical protein
MVEDMERPPRPPAVREPEDEGRRALSRVGASETESRELPQAGQNRLVDGTCWPQEGQAITLPPFFAEVSDDNDSAYHRGPRT